MRVFQGGGRGDRDRDRRSADTLQRRFLQTGGHILKSDDTITVRLDRRAYSPVLRSADVPDTTVPWWGGRRLHLEYADK